MNPDLNVAEEIEAVKSRIVDLVCAIQDAQEEKKDIVGGFNESIKELRNSQEESIKILGNLRAQQVENDKKK